MDISWKTVATGIISPEGPAADRAGNVFLVSRWTGKVVKVDASGRVSDLVHTGGKPQSVALLESGELLLADARNQALQRISTTGVLSTIAETVDGERFLGPNDLVLAGHSVVFLTDPGLDMESRGRILRIDIVSGATSVVAEGLAFPNGITITHDGRYLLLAESVTHRVLRFELLDNGIRLGAPAVFCQFADHHPDGIALDSEGNLLVTLCGGGTLEVVSPRGEGIDSIATGGVNCTNCVFGGDDFQTLYLTEDDQQALLATRWPVPGQRRYSRSLSGRSPRRANAQ
jgi:gluconolactonase